MPIAFEYPIPRHWQDFERMLKDLHPEMTVYGRAGQDQDGIDLVSSDGKIVIQAKKRGLGVEAITINQLSSWIKRAQAFHNKVPFNRLIIATTQKTDKDLQAELLIFIRNNDISMPFEVKILFWDAIEEMLIERPELTRKYYLTELYDPILISKFKSGSLDAYIQTTLFSAFTNGTAWPEVDELVGELPYRINPGYGHKLNLETLREDYEPFFIWCENIFSRAKLQENEINKKFNQAQLLPIEWACSYIEQLREVDLVAVLETEMELINWARKMHFLLKHLDNMKKRTALDDSSSFAKKCSEVCQSTSNLKAYIASNAEALSAYASLKDNLRKRGINEYRHINSELNIRIFGYYGYTLVSKEWATMGSSVELSCEPLKQIGVDVCITLHDTPFPIDLVFGRKYLRKFPECTKIEVHSRK